MVREMSKQKELINRLQSMIENMRLIGNLMSNSCFNLSQGSVLLDDHSKEILRDLYKKWDAIK